MVLQRHARGRAGRKWWARIKRVKIREAAGTSGNTPPPPLHPTPLHSTPLHSTPLRFTPLHPTIPHTTSPALRLQTLARGMIAREVFRHRHENAYRTLVEGPACLLIQSTWRMHAQYTLR